MTQGADETTGYLLETHLDMSRNVGAVELGLRALWAGWFLDSESGAAEALGRDEQTGYYIEPSLRWAVGDYGDMGVFARYAVWDNNAGASLIDTEEQQYNFGVNYWPHPNVVFKMDYQVEERPAGAEDDNRLDLGVGFQY